MTLDSRHFDDKAHTVTAHVQAALKKALLDESDCDHDAP